MLVPLADPSTLGGTYFIFSTILMFALVESVRYPYYFLKDQGWETTLLGRFYGYLRYSLFIFVYPIGASGEVVIAWGCLEPVI